MRRSLVHSFHCNFTYFCRFFFSPIMCAIFGHDFYTQGSLVDSFHCTLTYFCNFFHSLFLRAIFGNNFYVRGSFVHSFHCTLTYFCKFFHFPFLRAIFWHISTYEEVLCIAFTALIHLLTDFLLIHFCLGHVWKGGKSWVIWNPACFSSCLVELMLKPPLRSQLPRRQSFKD